MSSSSESDIDFILNYAETGDLTGKDIQSALHIGTFSPKEGKESDLQQALIKANADASHNLLVTHSIIAECNAKSDESNTEPRTFGIFFTYVSHSERDEHLTEINAPGELVSTLLQYTNEDKLPQNMLNVLSFYNKTDNLLPNETLALGLRGKLTLTNSNSENKVVKYLRDTAIDDLKDETQTLLWCAFRITISDSATNHFVVAPLFANTDGREAHKNGKVMKQINEFANNGDIEKDIDDRPAIPATSGFDQSSSTPHAMSH